MRLSRLAIGAFVGAAMALGQGSAEAQDLSEPAVIAVVNLERIMTEATAVVSAREQLQELSVKVQQDITERENKLREEDQGLQQQRALVSAEVFAQNVKEFQGRAAELQQRVRSVRQTLDEALEGTMERIQTFALEEIAKIAIERGVDVVLAQSQVVVARNVFDLTDPALEQLNKRVPTVKISGQLEDLAE